MSGTLPCADGPQRTSICLGRHARLGNILPLQGAGGVSGSVLPGNAIGPEAPAGQDVWRAGRDSLAFSAWAGSLSETGSVMGGMNS
jgi:hypothetical protein